MKDIPKLCIILLSTLISGLGMATFFIAVNWFIKQIGNESFYVALVNALCYLAVLFTLPYIGNICDKYSRKIILMVIYFIGITIQLIMCTLVNKGSASEAVFILITSSMIITVIKVTDQVCRTSYLQGVMNKKYYQLSNQWLEAVRQGITFIGGGASALLMRTPSLLTVLYFNIVTFMIGIFLICLLPKDIIDRNVQSINELSYLEKFKSGIAMLKIFDDKLIAILIISILPYVFVVSISITYPALFSGLSIINEAEFYAVLSIPYGAGALLASLINRKTSNQFNKFFIKHSLLFIFALFFGAILHNVYAIYGTVFLIAYCHAAIRIQRNTIIMNRADNRDIAKLLSFFEIVFTILVIIFSFVLGYICDHFSANCSWIFLAFIFLILLIFFIICNKSTVDN